MNRVIKDDRACPTDLLVQKGWQVHWLTRYSSYRTAVATFGTQSGLKLLDPAVTLHNEMRRILPVSSKSLEKGKCESPRGRSRRREPWAVTRSWSYDSYPSAC